MRTPTALARAVSLILLALGFGILVTGFFSTDIWSLLDEDRADDVLRISLYIALAALIVRFLRPMHYANALLLVWVALHVLIVGIGPAFAATTIAVAAVGLGSLALPERIPGRLPLAMIAGLGILAGTLGWLLPFPIHYRGVYLLLAAFIFWWRRRTIRRILLEQIAVWKSRVAVSPRLSAFAVLVLGLASTSTWLPTVHADDLVYHLALPGELREHAYYRMDPSSQMWALAPWAGDVVQGVASVVAGEDARPSVNLLWLATAVFLILELSRRLGGTPQAGWLAVGSAASLPLVIFLLAGMQTELASVAVSAGAALVVVSSGRKPDTRRLLLLSVCAGLGLGLKITNLLFMFSLAVWLLARWRFKLLWRELLPAAALFLVIAGSSYTYAELLTGNPVLPLFNNWFQSPYAAPGNFSDPRWLTPVRADLLWRLTFATDQYCECWAGAAGFHWLALVGVLPIALASRRTRGVVLCALLGASMVFAEVRYLRYILPVLVLLLPAFAASLRALISERVLAFIFIVLTGLNVFYGTNASWILRMGVVKSMVYPSEGREKILRALSPESLVADYVKGRHGKEIRILIADPARPPGAVFAGFAFTTSGYDPKVYGALFGGGSEPEAGKWRELFGELGVSHVLVTNASQSTGLSEALQAAEAEVEFRLADTTLYRLEGGFLPASIGNGTLPHLATWSTQQEQDGPVIADTRVRVECAKPEGGAFVAVRAYDDAGKELAAEVVSSSCPKAGDLAFAISLFSDVAPSRVEFETGMGAAQLLSPQVRLRKDAMKSRSLSARVRAWSF